MNLWIFVLIDRISNSQTSEPIGSLKSPMVDLVGEDVEEQEETKEEKEGVPQMFGSILLGRKLMGNLKLNAIIVASFTWMTLAKVHPTCVII